MINNKFRSAFTIVELIVVIAVIAILASIVVVAYGAWRTQVATASLKSDLEHAASSMESNRTFNNAYPPAVPTTFSASNGNTITLTVPNTKSFCIDGTSSNSTAIHYYIDNLTQTNGATVGTCAARTVTVTTLAGAGTNGFVDATGTSAQFYYPWGIAVDSWGTVYVADTHNNRIRKITPSGVVTTLAGSGAQGFADGVGTSAVFYGPGGIAVDSSGTVYVGDSGNNRIRKITPSGAVTTLAGSGAYGSTNGTGTSATFNSPSGVAVDNSGTIYVADQDSHLIRKVTAGGTVTTLAGSGTQGSANGTGTSAQFAQPTDVTVDSSGTVYVADSYSNKIRKITANGTVTTLAGSGVNGYADGPGTSAQFAFPVSVTVDSAGNVYVADQSNHRVRKITANGTVTTLAGSGVNGYADGPGTSAQFFDPDGVAVDSSGIIYMSDESGNRIRKIQ